MPSWFDLDEGLVEHLRRAADMEGAHGELGARLADRLGRDDADRLAHIDRRAAGEIAPIALAADAELASRRSEPSGCGISWIAGLLDLLDMRFEDLLARRRR